MTRPRTENTFEIITGVKESDFKDQFPQRGKMCLLRVKQQYEGKFLYRVLRKLRNILHFALPFVKRS